jgi:hypothetical protein
VAQNLRLAAFALLAPAFGVAYYGSTLVGQPGAGDTETIAPVEIAAAFDEATQQPVESAKADRETVKSDSSSANQAANVPPPVKEVKEIPPPVFADIIDKEEVKPLSAPVAEAAKDEAAKPAEEAKPQMAEAVAEPAVEPAAKVKPRAAHIEKKKKAKIAKRHAREKTRLAVPLVLVPPQKIAEPVEPDAAVKPVSEAPAVVRQNFGPAKTDDHFRRK